jgi:prepilin-type N-terminal cleavage/methylation domain-containing protein
MNYSHAMSRDRIEAFTLIEIMIVILIIGMLLAIAIPNFMSARENSRAKACVDNLKQIDTAKQQWLMDNKASSIASETWSSGSLSDSENLVGTYIREQPVCPAGGTYTTQNATTLPTCSVGTVTVGGRTYSHILS